MAVHEPVRQQVHHVERAIADPARPGARLAKPWRGPEQGLLGVLLLAGPANVIMQLARPGVGYGVMESRVESGRVDLHPVKRARTTFTYIAVANIGSDEQKAAFRRAVNRAHAQVYSTEDSPVQYNAFDTDLQLWVAACLYKGAVDVYRSFVGELSEEDAERHYRNGMALATTLQVPAEKWPADRQAFDEYWQRSLDQVHIDDAVREYLYPIAAARIKRLALPAVVRKVPESIALLITTGFLPQRFRDEMRLPWDAGRQRRFDLLIGALSAANRSMPKFVQQFPFNVVLWDLDRRIKAGRPLV